MILRYINFRYLSIYLGSHVCVYVCMNGPSEPRGPLGISVALISVSLAFSRTLVVHVHSAGLSPVTPAESADVSQFTTVDQYCYRQIYAKVMYM